MDEEFRHLRLQRDARGVATVSLDVKDVPMNVFNDEVARELQQVLERIQRDPPRALVIRSAKPSGFLAGADVRQIRKLETEEQVRSVLTAGQELFNRIEQLPFPTVAVIHGPCLGGGLELALVCRHRVARDDAQTKLGLPEVQLGLIPGWGGTQRLPRLVGLRRALQMILESSNLSAAKATKAGLVDLAVPTEQFESAVERFIEDRLAGQPGGGRPGRGLLGNLLDGTRVGRAVVLRSARKRIRSREADYPALAAALRAVEAGYRGSPAEGFAIERAEFAKVVFTPTARNLIELFFQRERARKPATWVAAGLASAPVRKAAVVGAGTMGAGIAQLVALNGIAVVMKDINDEIVASGMKKIESLAGDAVAKGALARDAADAALRLVTPTADWNSLAGTDVAIEAVIEREDVKRDVFRRLAEELGPTAVLASNTSALSVARLAETTPNPERVAGLHFFNPVHKMHLVEVIRAPGTNDATIAALVELVRRLGKVPVVVADSPGFLVNRILFPYLDEAVRVTIETGRPVADSAAVSFGMPMGPLELLDQIGIDIAADVAKTFAALARDVGPTPERFAAMVKDGALGKKSGRGFYEYREGSRSPSRWANDPGKPEPPRVEPPRGQLSPIQKRLIYPLINQAAKCLEAGVVAEPWVVDLAMVLGTGFAPFRGGPLRTADALGVSRVVDELDALRRELGERFEPAPLLRVMAKERRQFHVPAREGA